MPYLLNSTVRALGIGTAFRKHPVVMDYFLHGYKNIFSSLCNYMLTNPSSIDPPSDTPQKKNGQENIFIPNSGAVSIGQKVTSQQKLRFLDTGEMFPITDIYRHKAPRSL